MASHGTARCPESVERAAFVPAGLLPAKPSCVWFEAEFVTAPASIEGLELLVRGQAIDTTLTPRLLRGTEDTVIYPLSVKKQGRGKITQPYLPNKEKKLTAVYDKNSHLNKGDTIVGTNLWGFAIDPIGPVAKGGVGRTARHTGQSVDLENGAYLSLVQGVMGLSLPVHPKGIFLG